MGSFDLFYENIKFKIIEYDDENATYMCSFVISISGDFMQNNIPENLIPGNTMVLYHKKNPEIWVVNLLSVDHFDDIRYGLNMHGLCTFVLSSKSAQCGTCEYGIELV
jgi:hypothetical protein